MSVRWLQLAGVAVVLAGCPKDPDAVNPRRDVVVMDADADAADSGDGMVPPDRIDAGDGGADADVTTATDASITFTFVSGTVTGAAGEASIEGRFTWHGSIRGESADRQTRIEAFFQ